MPGSFERNPTTDLRWTKPNRDRCKGSLRPRKRMPTKQSSQQKQQSRTPTGCLSCQTELVADHFALVAKTDFHKTHRRQLQSRSQALPALPVRTQPSKCCDKPVSRRQKEMCRPTTNPPAPRPTAPPWYQPILPAEKQPTSQRDVARTRRCSSTTTESTRPHSMASSQDPLVLDRSPIRSTAIR